MKAHHRKQRGFTLMEISVTASILLMLAGMAVPAFSDTIGDAEVASAQSMLSRVRTGVDFYNLQHRDQFPGEVSNIWEASTFDNQLRKSSDIDGNTAIQGTAGYPFGPYLTEPLPANPFNDLATVMLIAPGGSFSTPDDSTGWIYWADTGAFKINCSGNTSQGEAIYNL